jgi:leucyl aminopeptidase
MKWQGYSQIVQLCLIQAGKISGEGFYRMPMGENWAKMIESPIADMQNIGGPYGGSTTAAEFLYKFVDKETAWAHLDIAGMCWESSGKSITPKGAAGFGVRTLFNFADMVPNAKKQKVYTVDEDMSY